MEETTLPEIDALSSLDTDDLHGFAEEALTHIEGHLESNRKEAERMTDVEQSVDEVLADSNIDHVQVRARPFENPRVTVWLKDCPMWANTAWNDHIYPNGINAYNGKVMTTFDVRPF